MGVQTEGVYRCIVRLENDDYPIVEVSTGVLVKLPGKHISGRGGGTLRGRGSPRREGVGCCSLLISYAHRRCTVLTAS